MTDKNMAENRDKVIVRTSAGARLGGSGSRLVKEMRFNVVFSFDIAPKEGSTILYEEMRKAYPDYTLQIVPDVDVSASD